MANATDAENRYRETRGRGEIDRALRGRFGDRHYQVLAITAIVCSVGVIGTDVLMWFLVPGYNPAAETISDLAAGHRHEVQDAGIVLFSLGIAALTLGLALRDRADRLSIAVRVGFILLALDVAAIALWNEYGDRDPGGLVLHQYFVWFLYGTVALLLWFAPVIVPSDNRSRLRSVGRAASVVWVVAAPLFYIVPPGIDGAYERLLGSFLVGTVILSALQLYRSADA